jgi:hypothetical protein
MFVNSHVLFSYITFADDVTPEEPHAARTVITAKLNRNDVSSRSAYNVLKNER